MNAISPSTPSPQLDQTLASYLPRYQFRLIVQGFRPSPDPFIENRFGAILLVDVSGFTALTECFAAQGMAGAEMLSSILNRYFGQIADIITACGGDIIAFAGDSALAMWPGEESDLAANVLRAIQAAFSIQFELDRYEPVRGALLRQRAGVGCGALQLMELGGISERWQFVVTGNPVTEASIANREAQPGEVLLSSGAWDVVKNHLHGTPLPSGLVRATEVTALELPSLPPADPASTTQSLESLSVLSQYVPAVVFDRLRAGQEQWIAEFRTISMLFLNLAESQINSSAAIASLHQDLRCIQEVLERFEGTLYQFLMDEKGLTAACAFGLPPLAHENDPRRALEAGIALREELACRGVSTSAGIATGTVFCGIYGSANRRQYTTLGSTINLSARLMQSADGSILCDDATLRAAGSTSTLHFQPKGEIPVKGRSALIPVFAPSHRSEAAPTGVSAAVSSQVHLMIGREAERAALADALTALVERGESCCIIVEGEAGVGKSCLLEHLSQQVEETNRKGQKISCWRAAADSIQQSTPYHVWRAVFREALQLAAVPVMAQRDHVLAQLATRPDLLLLAPLLNVVIPLGITENATTAALEGRTRAENAQHLLVSILKLAATRSATVVILEDAHWFDSSSLRLAVLAAQQIVPLLLVLSTRPFAEPRPTELTALLALSASRHLALGVLDSDLALQMVCQRLGVRRLPPEGARFIHERAGGHPLFSLQLACALRDTGLMEITDGRCQIAETATGAAFDSALSAMRFPSTVEGVITSRLDRMPAAQQLTVKVASVLGRNFDLPTLSEIYPVETARTQLPAHLDEIEMLDLIHRIDANDPVYAFKHAIIQDVAYNSIPFVQRRQLHRSVAEWYELEFRNNLPAYYPLLAHHWNRAQVVPKAVHYCSEAGSQALRNYANPEAVRFLSEALSLDEKEEKEEHEEIASSQSVAARRAEWELQLGRAYVNWSKYIEGRTHLERGLSLQLERVPVGSVSTARALLTEVARQCVHRALPARYLGRRHRERESLLKSSGNFEALTEIYFLQNKSLQCLFAVFRSLNLAELAGASPELARGYSSAGFLLGFMTLHRAANAYFTLAGKVSADIDHPASRAWVSVARAMYLAGIGQWDLAATLLNDAILTSDRLGDRRRGDDARVTLLMVQILQGSFRQSLTLANSLYASAKERLDIRIQAETLYGKSWNLLMLGRQQEFPDCLEELDSLRSAQVKVGGRHQKQDVDSLYALLHLFSGDLAAAKQAVDRLAQAFRRTYFYGDILLHSAITEVCLALWQTAKARKQIAAFPGFDSNHLEDAVRRAVKALHRYCHVFPIGKPLLYLRRGQYQWIKGNRTEALKYWRHSLQAAIGLQADYYQGLAHLELATHLDSNHPAKISHQHEAHEILTRLDAARDLARLSGAPAAETT
jgi:class 3 adenylate cyclase/tetratricopeptide (TPR) repeat protein